MKDKNAADKKIYREIIEAIEKLSYGEIIIKVHDSKVVQIEKVEKKRF